MKLITLFALILTLNACSFSESGKEDVASHSDDLEFAVDTLSDRPENMEFKVEEQKIAQADEIETTLPGPTSDSGPDTGDIPPDQFSLDEAPSEPTFSEFTRPEPKEVKIAEVPEPAPIIEKVEKKKVHVTEAPARIHIEEPTASVNYGAMETYRFQKHDTLMMVAFKIYGDYRKWKDLKKWNKGVTITEGTDVKYYVPEQKFGWRPEGLPYMVKTGDTLQIISMDKYKTTRKWKSIYENNRPLIRDPDLIFAGFTIYYRPMRDLASEAK